MQKFMVTAILQKNKKQNFCCRELKYWRSTARGIKNQLDTYNVNHHAPRAQNLLLLTTLKYEYNAWYKAVQIW